MDVGRTFIAFAVTVLAVTCVSGHGEPTRGNQTELCFVEEIQNYTNCVKPLGMGTTKAVNFADLVSKLCKPEGKTAVHCILDVIDRCPDIKETADTMFPFMPQDDQGSADFSDAGLAKFCRSRGTGTGAPTVGCAQQSAAAAITCLQKLLIGEPEISDPGEAAESGGVFDTVVSAAVFLCGEKGEKQLNCIRDAYKNCAATESFIKGKMGHEHMDPLVYHKTIGTWRRRNCGTSKFENFKSQSSCIGTNLKSKTLGNCEAMHPNQKGIFPCGSEKKLGSCLNAGVGKNCSQDAADVTLSYLQATVWKTPDDCPEDGAVSERSSTKPILVAFLLILSKYA